LMVAFCSVILRSGFSTKDLGVGSFRVNCEILRSAQDDSKIEVYATIASPEGRNLGLALVCHPEERFFDEGSRV